MILESLHLIKAYSARAMNYLESYSISKDDLLSVAANFPGMLLRTNPNPNPNPNLNPNPNPNPNPDPNPNQACCCTSARAPSSSPSSGR